MRGTPPELKIKVVMSKVVFKGLPNPGSSPGCGRPADFWVAATSIGFEAARAQRMRNSTLKVPRLQ